MKALDLIATARLLAEHPRRGRPPEANLRRAVSTAYYALFHCLAANCADMVVGGQSAMRNQESWRQVYRALDHGPAKRRCGDRNTLSGFPSEIRQFAQVFIQMLDLRHSADYDPDSDVPTRDEVIKYINDAEDTIRQFPASPIVDRRSFAVHVLMGARRGYRSG